jgi:hypothetical protein
MDAGNPFQPRALSTVQLAVTTTSAPIQFASVTIASGLDNRCCLVSNSTSITAYVEFGAASTVVATPPGAFAVAGTGSAPVLGNQQRVFVTTGNAWAAAAATSATGTTITITPGQGGI